MRRVADDYWIREIRPFCCVSITDATRDSTYLLATNNVDAIDLLPSRDEMIARFSKLLKFIQCERSKILFAIYFYMFLQIGCISVSTIRQPKTKINEEMKKKKKCS